MPRRILHQVVVSGVEELKNKNKNVKAAGRGALL